MRRMLTYENEIVAVHAGASLPVQRMTAFAAARPDIQEYKKWAEIAVGIKT